MGEVFSGWCAVNGTRFFTGLHQPSDARHFRAAFVSVNRLRPRKADLKVRDWIMDSGAFTEVVRHGGYRFEVEEYAAQIRRWSRCGNLLAAVAQDFMCEPFVLEKTGCTVREHQAMTLDRYDRLLGCDVAGVYIMPVLQGYRPEEYVEHIRMYGARLVAGAWVGVGSVCKRNSDARQVEGVLHAIHAERPDLRLHGFGVKTTALQSGIVQVLLYSADSMAWSYHARINGRSANDWHEAKKWAARVENMHVQWPIQFWAA